MKQRGSTCEIVGDKCSAPTKRRPILPNLAGEKRIRESESREREREIWKMCFGFGERERGGP